MKGSVYRRGITWTAHVSWQQAGRQRQAKKGGYRTRKEAEQQLTELTGAVQGGRYVPVGRRTVADYLEGWLASLPTTGRKPTTITAYRWLVRSHAIPELGDIPLVDLTAVDLDRLYSVMAAKGLKLRTVRHCHSAMHQALCRMRPTRGSCPPTRRRRPPRRKRQRPGPPRHQHGHPGSWPPSSSRPPTISSAPSSG